MATGGISFLQVSRRVYLMWKINIMIMRRKNYKLLTNRLRQRKPVALHANIRGPDGKGINGTKDKWLSWKIISLKYEWLGLDKREQGWWSWLGGFPDSETLSLCFLVWDLESKTRQPTVCPQLPLQPPGVGQEREGNRKDLCKSAMEI